MAKDADLDAFWLGTLGIGTLLREIQGQVSIYCIRLAEPGYNQRKIKQKSEAGYVTPFRIGSAPLGVPRPHGSGWTLPCSG